LISPSEIQTISCFEKQKYELQEYYEKLGKNYYTDGVDYSEFEKKAMSEVRRLDNVEELRNSFIALDFSCKGFLTIEDLTKQFELIAPRMSKKTVFDIFKEMDRDFDGRISYKDFEFAMEYINDEGSLRDFSSFELTD